MKLLLQKISNNIYFASRNIAVLIFLIGIILFYSCTSESEDPQIEPKPITLDLSYLPMGDATTTPYIQGTIIDFWDKGNWTSTDWNTHMSEMKAIGIKTLIVQFTAYGEYIWIHSNTNYSTEKFPNALSLLLEAATKKNIGVYVGLYFNDEYWNKSTDVSTLKIHAQRSKNIAQEIWTQNKTKSSFKGWYITHEPAAYYYQTQGDFNILKNNLINPVAQYCKSISGKPVGISAFFNKDLTPVDTFKNFFTWLGKSDIELLLLQDGTGVYHSDVTSLEAYYIAANRALYDNNFKGAFWAITETFKNLSPSNDNSNPESFDIIKQKLEIEDEYVSFIVTFQYYKDMCPTGPGTTLAKKLRDDYKNYLP